MSGENSIEAQAQEIVRVEPKQLSRRDPFKIAQAFAASQLFPGLTLEAAVVKIIAGEELGIGPMAAIKGIDVIEGNLGYRGNLVATLVKQHPRYDYAVLEKTKERCTLQFLIDGKPAPGDEEGKATFSIEDAQTAGLVKPKSGWEKWPRAMCFNRALTEGVRAYIPDVTAGAPAYTDDEIREVISVEAEVEQVAAGETAKLPPERVAHLIDGIEIAKPALAETGVNWLDGLNVMLGSIDIDGFEPGVDLEVELAKFSEADADQLDTALQALADEEADRVEREAAS